MASLPSFSVTRTLKLDPESRKLPSSSLASSKVSQSPSTSYQSGHTINQLDGVSEPVRPLNFREALSLITEGTEVESSYYVPLLQECIDKNSASNAQAVHAHIMKTGAHEDVFIMTFLVNAYAKCGRMENALLVFENLTRRNVVAWTSLMAGYVQNSQPELAINVFLEMLETGSYPTNYTLGAAINACCSLQSVELGRQIHGYIIKYQIEGDTSAGNSLCSFYSTCGNLSSAVKAFIRIKEKNVISWTTVISACGDNGRAAKGLRFFVDMMTEGIGPNEYTLTSVMSLCCTTASLNVGLQVHSLSIKLGYDSYIPVTNSIMYLYLKCGSKNEAHKLFHSMESLTLVSWNALMAGHAQIMDLAKDVLSAHLSGTEALKIFLNLNRLCIKPDLYTFSTILTVCGRLVALEQGEQVHAQALKTGFLSDVIVGTALVNMYNKCGSIERASKAFVEMSARTLISWTSIITGFARHGQAEQALQLFEDMRIAGVRPNQITFVGVLSACSHAGMVSEALGYFEMMQKDYKMKPVMDHFACLIDMYIRLGRLDDAFDFVEKMDLEPNEYIWSLLVAGCKNLGKTEMGFYAADRLLKLKPRNNQILVLLLDLYISAERWEEVSKVRDLIKEEKLKSVEDWTWISIKEKVYSFKTNDGMHSQSQDMYRLLDELLEKAKSNGYQLVESFEVIEEEDGAKTFSSIVYHSEKLAIAFGLLNVPNFVPVRVVKSTSMCKDCHEFVKAVSVLASRKIIVRDSRRLHKFVNGHCLCGDFGALL